MLQKVQLHHACVADADAFASVIAEAVLLTMSCHRLEILKMIDWIPVGFVIFKVLTLSICMFYAVKWHYDQGKKGKDTRAVLVASGKVAGTFMLVLLGLGFGAFALARMLGLDLSMP